MELEVEHTEVAVGPYSADILARDSGSGDPVVIENQLGKTNHDHLGKAITYAAALGASTVVWIAPDFTEEHRKAVESGTGDDLWRSVTGPNVTRHRSPPLEAAEFASAKCK